MIQMIGTVHNAVKLTALEQKWQQQKQDIKKTLKERYGNTQQGKDALNILQFREQLEQINQNRDRAAIDAKLQSGTELTPEEIAYLKAHDPQAYNAYEEMKLKQKAYEKQLENCETKEEVEKLKQVKMGEFLAQVKEVSNNSVIPKGQKLAMIEKIHAEAKNIEKTHEKFVKTAFYASLPTEEEKREQEEADNEGTVTKAEASSEYIIETEETEENDAAQELQTVDGERVKGDDTEGKDTKKAEVSPKPVKKASYKEVAAAVKGFIEVNRPAGAGLGTMQAVLELEHREETKVK